MTDDEAIDRYQQMLAEREEKMKDPRYQRMVDRFEPGWGSYLDIPVSWFDLVFELDDKLNEIDPEYTLLQVKIKFDGLRFYYQQSDVAANNLTDAEKKEFRRLVDEAEAKSYDIKD